MDGDDRVDGRDDGGGGRDEGGGGRDEGGRRYFPPYFPSSHFLFLSFLDFSPFSLIFFKFEKNLHEIRIWRSFWFLKRVCNECEV